MMMIRNNGAITAAVRRILSQRRRGISALTHRVSHATSKRLLMGCVSYDPAVNEIWSGFQRYLRGVGVPFDYVLYTNYEAQVYSLINGHIDVAWNGPIAHVMTEELVANGNVVVSLGMRDVDRDFQSVVAVRKDANVTKLEDLKHRHIATGSSDSPQAHVVPLYYLKSQFQDDTTALDNVTVFEADVGMHGDTAVGEVKALEALLANNSNSTTTKASSKRTDAALVSKMMWDRAVQGKIPSVDATKLQETCHELSSVQLPTFDHCQFDAIIIDNNPNTSNTRQKLNDFGEALLSMEWENPEHQRLMKLEGIQRKWELPRQTGYDIVRKAMGVDWSKHRHATNFNFQKRFYSASSSSTASTAATTTTTSTSPPTPPPRRVAVIGAGIAGLQTLRAFQAHGLNVTAFEASSTVGGLWQANYSNFGVQVPKQLFEFQDYPMKSVAWGNFATGPQVQTYIEEYTNAFGLRDFIQFNTKVTGVQQTSDGKWKVNTETKNGTLGTLEFDYLVMARGLYGGTSKYIPSFPGQERFSGEIVHSGDFRDASFAKGKRVVIVGGGKSGSDCALEAFRGGASSVTLLQRSAQWPTPRKIAGIIPFQYVFLSRFGTALVSLRSGFYPDGRKKASMLIRPVFALVEALFALQFDLQGALRPKLDVVSGLYKTALIMDSSFTKARQAGKVTVRLGEISEYVGEYGSDKALLLKDGPTIDADLVVFATGFHQDYSIFSDPATREKLDFQSDGLYLYRYILPEKVENLAFVGHMAAISNISSYGLQAEWLARKLVGKLSSADPDVMRKDIETRKSWARSWMPESAYRGMLVLLHQTHYHDQLLRDMGLNPHRKSNVLSEYLMPYEPADYNGIMGGKAKAP